MTRLHCDPARLRAERGHLLVLGHRGMPGDQVENRIEGFEAALRAGADGVEFDVQLAADGVPVVFHDLSLERTTGHPGRVGDLFGEELRKLGVPSLDAVLGHLSPEAVLNIEIKDFRSSDRGLERSVVDLVRRHGAESRVLFSSFNPLALARIRRLDRLFYTAQLTAPGVFAVLRLGYLARLSAVHPHVSEVTPGRLRGWRHRGRRVVLWGDASEAELGAVLGWDIDGVITDRPAAAVKLRGGLH